LGFFVLGIDYDADHADFFGQPMATAWAVVALEEYLGDMEDVYLTEATLERIKRGEERVLSSEEFWRGVKEVYR
jgi:predicted DNA-binding protein